jgi:hypothetical protein
MDVFSLLKDHPTEGKGTAHQSWAEEEEEERQRGGERERIYELEKNVFFFFYFSFSSPSLAHCIGPSVPELFFFFSFVRVCCRERLSVVPFLN